MKIPNGFSEQDVLICIENAVGSLANCFKFGYYDKDDMLQEGRIFALEALESFDQDNPQKCSLTNFLRIHIRNRFINMRRDKLERKQTPCHLCCFQSTKEQNQCSVFDDIYECEKWRQWHKRNTAKKNLMELYEIDPMDSKQEHKYQDGSIDIVGGAINNEILAVVSHNMPSALKSDFLQWKDGVRLHKSKRLTILVTICEILLKEFPNMKKEIAYILDIEKEDEEDDDE